MTSININKNHPDYRSNLGLCNDIQELDEELFLKKWQPHIVKQIEFNSHPFYILKNPNKKCQLKHKYLGIQYNSVPKGWIFRLLYNQIINNDSSIVFNYFFMTSCPEIQVFNDSPTIKLCGFISIDQLENTLFVKGI